MKRRRRRRRRGRRKRRRRNKEPEDYKVQELFCTLWQSNNIKSAISILFFGINFRGNVTLFILCGPEKKKPYSHNFPRKVRLKKRTLNIYIFHAENLSSHTEFKYTIRNIQTSDIHGISITIWTLVLCSYFFFFMWSGCFIFIVNCKKMPRKRFILGGEFYFIVVRKIKGLLDVLMMHFD